MPAKSVHRLKSDDTPTFRFAQFLLGTLCMFQKLIRNQAGCTKSIRYGYQTCLKKQHNLRSKFSSADTDGNQISRAPKIPHKKPRKSGVFYIHSNCTYAKSSARSPSSSLMRDGKPIWFRIWRNGFGLSSSTLTIFFTSHSPEAIRIAAATGGTPAV